MKSILNLALAVTAAASPVIIDTIHNGAAEILSSTNAKVIPNSYMVVFKDHVTSASAAAHQEWVQAIHLDQEQVHLELRKRGQKTFKEEIFSGLKHVYNLPGLLGYAGHFSEDVIEQVRNHPDVSSQQEYILNNCLLILSETFLLWKDLKLHREVDVVE